MNKTIFVLGDIHFPYQNQAALNKVYKDIEELKPTYIIQMGDLFDQYAFSRFAKSANFVTPEKELAAGFKQAKLMWETIQKLSPNSKCLQIMGNHDIRIFKRVGDKLPELASLIAEPVNKLYTFKNVKTNYDYRTEINIEGLLFHHGYLSQLGAHMRKYNRSIVVGHSHTGGVVYNKVAGKIIFELNAGYLANGKALPLQYGEAKTKSWTVGYGLLTKKDGRWQPQFVSLE